jgi:hypothetical protein
MNRYRISIHGRGGHARSPLLKRICENVAARFSTRRLPSHFDGESQKDLYWPRE